MSGYELLESLQTHAESTGYTLVARDAPAQDGFLPPDQFVVKDHQGFLYRVYVEDLHHSSVGRPATGLL